MTKSNLPLDVNVEVEANITDTINSVSKNTLGEPTKKVGDIAATILSFAHNFFLYPLQKYNIYAIDKLEKYEESLKEKINNIKPTEITGSSVNIMGPVIENLKYNLDEEHIKEMFTNILISDMTKSLKKKVSPAFIEIVKQLSNEDASLLMALKEFNTRSFSTLVMKDTDSKENTYRIINYVIVPSNDFQITPSLITLDNLERLGIIKIYFNKKINNEQKMCEETFKDIKNTYKYKTIFKLSYELAVIEITSLGCSFIEVCTR